MKKTQIQTFEISDKPKTSLFEQPFWLFLWRLGWCKWRVKRAFSLIYQGDGKTLSEPMQHQHDRLLLLVTSLRNSTTQRKKAISEAFKGWKKESTNNGCIKATYLNTIFKFWLE